VTAAQLIAWVLMVWWWWRERPARRPTPSVRPPSPGLRTALAARPTLAAIVVALLGVALLAVRWPVAGIVLLVASLLAQRLRRRARAQRRVSARRNDVMLLVALLEISLHGGITIRRAVEEVHGWLDHELAGAVGDALTATERAGQLGEQLDVVASRSVPELHRLAQVVRAAELYGAPAAQGLAALSSELRLEHRRDLERNARRLPVRLLGPLIGGVLPAFALLTVVPMLVSALGSLQLVRP
jgi:Flp pilus assembly protein TadB